MRFVQVDAPGRYGAESECEIRQIFELEDFPVDPAEKARRLAAAGTGPASRRRTIGETPCKKSPRSCGSTIKLKRR